jgi:hypothetical protein
MAKTTSKADDTVTAEDADASSTSAAKGKSEEAPAESGTAYLNTTTGPITYSKVGHQVGGGEWTAAVNLDAIGQKARSRGFLKPRSAL